MMAQERGSITLIDRNGRRFAATAVMLTKQDGTGLSSVTIVCSGRPQEFLATDVADLEYRVGVAAYCVYCERPFEEPKKEGA